MPPIAGDCRLIPAEERSYYGVDHVRVLASNSPHPTFESPPHGIFLGCRVPKRLFGTCNDDEFYDCWGNGLEEKIVDIVDVAIKKFAARGTLSVLRSGFDKDTDKNPITVFVGIYKDDSWVLSDADALILLKSLDSAIQEVWSGKGVYVDICEIPLQSDEEEAPKTASYFPGHLPTIFERELPPYFGSSIGSDEYTGTLTAYVQPKGHDSNGNGSQTSLYALTW